MNDGLKQRIVGAAVLVVLAVIFLPMVFNFKGIGEIDQRSRIPARPVIDPVTVPDPQRPLQDRAPASPQQAYQFDRSRAEAEQPERGAVDDDQRSETTAESPQDETPEPALDARGLPLGWVIQVGSFRERDKAEQLVKKLLNDNFRAYLRAAQHQGKELFRVYVGPSIDKQRALNDQQKIDAKYGVKSLLLKFEA